MDSITCPECGKECDENAKFPLDEVYIKQYRKCLDCFIDDIKEKGGGDYENAKEKEEAFKEDQESLSESRNLDLKAGQFD